ncbi:MAG: BON domain-containing protein [Acidiferrobacteraceae bacterium]
MNGRRGLRILCWLAASGALASCAPAVIGGAAGAGLTAHDSRSFGTVVDDHLIELRARGAIYGNPDLRHEAHIGVYSENGTLLLTGQATSPELRDKALLLVRSVPHVKRIVNQIEIAPPSTLGQRAEDSLLTAEVKARIAAAGGVDPTHVRVITSDQVVYLMGLVPASQGQIAAKAASRTPGVRRVVELFEFNR